MLFGEQGNDLILGEDGADTIIGGLGRDTMTGGAGADRFFSANFEIAAGEVDLITDFDAADRYLFQAGAQLQYFNFNAPGYGVGAGIHVQVRAGCSSSTSSGPPPRSCRRRRSSSEAGVQSRAHPVGRMPGLTAPPA